MSRRGASFIDLIVALGIIGFLFGGIYLTYFSILDATNNVEFRTDAVSVINREVEVIRNLPFDQVGTVGGVPAGIIPQQQSVAFGGETFVLNTTIRNIDDPFDGTLGGNPNDTAPADYKLVSLEVSCPTCSRFVPILFTTTVAPKNLENTSTTGSLFINIKSAERRILRISNTQRHFCSSTAI